MSVALLGERVGFGLVLLDLLQREQELQPGTGSHVIKDASACAARPMDVEGFSLTGHYWAPDFGETWCPAHSALLHTLCPHSTRAGDGGVLLSVLFGVPEGRGTSSG